MTGVRIDSVWDLLVARIAALESRVDALEAVPGDETWAVGQADMLGALDEEDPDEFWIGGTD